MELNLNDKVKELVSRSRVGMLGTKEAGFIRYRPMSHVDIDDDGNIWFFTSKNSWKAEDIQRNPTVQLIYINANDGIYLSIDGTAHLSHDTQRMKELFNPFVKAWFPKGLKDPSLALLIVHPMEIDYWSNDDAKILTNVKILTAATMDSHPAGRRGKLALK